MKILLDECVDRRLARDLEDHHVSTVPKMGWSGKRNGDLLALAQSQFDVLVTVDRNLTAQQHLQRFSIAVMILRAPTNRLVDLRPLIPEILSRLLTAAPGAAITIGPTA